MLLLRGQQGFAGGGLAPTSTRSKSYRRTCLDASELLAFDDKNTIKYFNLVVSFKQLFIIYSLFLVVEFLGFGVFGLWGWHSSPPEAHPVTQ